MSMHLKQLLSSAILRDLAGAASFRRGEEYAADGHVTGLAVDGDRISARVLGTDEYRVGVWVASGALEYDCTCPVGRDGDFCKHCVAVGLVWLAEESPDGAGSRRRKPGAPRVVSMEEIRSFLGRQDRATLVDLLVDHAMEDEGLLDRLVLRAAREAVGGPDLARFRAVIERSLYTGEFVDYDSAGGYAGRIADTLEEIPLLLGEGHADAVVELTEYALGQVETAIGYVDDSDGHLGGILERIQEIHLEACTKAPPEPVSLARRLFAVELRSEYGAFHGAAATYATLLGSTGLAEYRRLAEEEWRKLPALGPGADDAQRWGRRFRLTQMMEVLARLGGDLEELVAIKSRDLSHPYAFLQVAELYRDAGDHDRALEWAERGLAAFPARPDGRLRQFLAQEYHRRGCNDEAMQLIWSDFLGVPRLDRYQLLKEHASRVGAWPSWRERAQSVLRSGPTQETSRPLPDSWRAAAGRAELVRVLLWEKEVEAAWREASGGGCPEDLWLELARLREADHPEDALGVYQRQVEAMVSRTGRTAYEGAIQLLRRVRKVMRRLGREEDYRQYLAQLRERHRRKRSFLGMLDAARLA